MNIRRGTWILSVITKEMRHAMRLAFRNHRMRPSSVIVALTLLFFTAGIRSVAAACGPAPGVTTDRFDYGPSDIVTISGAGFECGAVLSVLVTAPDNSTFSGDGTGSAGPDFVVSDDNGAFTLSYRLSGMLPTGDVYMGQVGTYQVNVLDTNGTLVASTAFTDGQANHSCVVMTSGGVKCWGSNGNGQLGDGTGTDRSTPVNVMALASGVAQVSLGNSHSCVLTTNGGVKCWGGGWLGDGSKNPGTATPVDVVGLTSGVIQISVGGAHTCAVTAVGGVKCWGLNNSGQLGDGTIDIRFTPVDVSGLTSGVVQVTASLYNTCALTTSGGVKCWGDNGSGQLGNNTLTGSTTPVDVSGLASGVAQISLGGNHTCAVTTGGGVKCWGRGEFGQLGNNTLTRSKTPVDVSGLASGVVQISLGNTHSCAVTTGGGVKCWGSNAVGNLGDSTLTLRSTPADVTDLSGVTQITAGDNHSCALTAAGGVKCWGYNAWGQLGDGSKTTRSTAVNVLGLDNGVTQLWDRGSLITDSDAPNASPTQVPAAADGWNNTDVIVTWNWTDAGGSGVDAANCTASSTSSGEGTITLTATCRDVAGNVGSASYAVRVDKTKPTISAAATTSPSAAGWYNGNVTVHFTCADSGGSGIAPVNGCPADETLSSEGTAVASTIVTALDVAGNESSLSNVVTVKIDKTKPTVSAAATTSPNAGGWYMSDVTIHFTCTDLLSGIPASSCPPDQTLSADGAAVASTPVTVTDAAGNVSDPSNVVTVKIDKTKPTITAAANTSPNLAGWYDADVIVHFTCADAGSGIPAGACPVDQTLSLEGTAVASTAQTVTDAAGRVSDPSNIVTIKIDKTKPTITAAATTSPNSAGWYKGNVTVHFTCTDGGSGIPAGACPADQTLSLEGAGIASTAHTVTDAAGNVSFSSNVVTVKIDKTNPTLSPIVNPNPVLLNGTATATSGAADALSGLASQSCDPVVTTSVAAKSVNCTATDNAGNTISTSASYQVNYAWTGFFQPVDNLPTVNQVKAGSGVPTKFSLSGNQGLSIFMAGYPVSQPIACDSGAPLNDVEETLTAGGSSLSYDPVSGQYTYVWKTDKVWALTCRQLVVKLSDGTEHKANFKLK